MVITAGTASGAPEHWRADVAGNTPVEFLTALTSAVSEHLEAVPDPDLIELVVDPQEWVEVDDLGLVGIQSRDGHAFMVGRPTGSPAAPLHGDEAIVWRIGAVTLEHGALWSVSFTQQTPPFVVNTVLSQTLSSQPITRPATETLPAGLAPLVSVRPAQGVTGQHRWRTADGPPPSPAHGRGTPPTR